MPSKIVGRPRPRKASTDDDTPALSDAQIVYQRPRDSDIPSPNSSLTLESPKEAIAGDTVPPQTEDEKRVPDSAEQQQQPPSVRRRNALEPMETWRVVLINSSLGVGFFLSIMDTSIVSTAILTIVEEYQAFGAATWLILAYTLTYLGFSVIVTRLADVFGRRDVVIVSYILFISMSLGCGWSTSLQSLIAFRALSGIAGAGLYAMTLVILPEISSLKMLPFISAFIGVLVAIAGVLGPILGGVISQNSTWRWIFWMNGPAGIVPLIVFILAWPKHHHGFELVQQKFADIDHLGCLLILAGCTLFIFGLQQAGVGAYDWSSPIVICTIVFGWVCLLALFAWEVYIWRRFGDRIAMAMPARIFVSRVMVAAIVNTLLTGFPMFLLIFAIPLRFQIVNLNTPLQAGINLLPYLGSMAFGTMCGGAVSAFKNRVCGTFVVASICMLIGAGALSTLPTDFEISAGAYGYQTVVGFGIGLTLSNVSLFTSLECDFRDHAVGQGIVGQARVLGGSIGVAASTAIFNIQLHQRLTGLLTSDQINAIQTSYGSITSTLRPDQLLAIREVYGDSFNESLRVCVYFSAAGLVASLFTYQRHPISITRRKAELEDALRELHVARAAKQSAV